MQRKEHAQGQDFQRQPQPLEQQIPNSLRTYNLFEFRHVVICGVQGTVEYSWYLWLPSGVPRLERRKQGFI